MNVNSFLYNFTVRKKKARKILGFNNTMTYKARPGIEFLHVCGVHMLVGTRATWDVCPHMTELSKGAAIAWPLLAEGQKPHAVAEILADFFHRPVEEAEEMLPVFIQQLVDKGYLIEIEDSEKEP